MKSSQLNSLKTFLSTLALNDALRQQGSENYFSFKEIRPGMSEAQTSCVFMTPVPTCWLFEKTHTHEGQSLNISCVFNLFRISLQAFFFFSFFPAHLPTLSSSLTALILQSLLFQCAISLFLSHIYPHLLVLKHYFRLLHLHKSIQTMHRFS